VLKLDSYICVQFYVRYSYKLLLAFRFIRNVGREADDILFQIERLKEATKTKQPHFLGK